MFGLEFLVYVIAFELISYQWRSRAPLLWIKATLWFSAGLTWLQIFTGIRVRRACRPLKHVGVCVWQDTLKSAFSVAFSCIRDSGCCLKQGAIVCMIFYHPQSWDWDETRHCMELTLPNGPDSSWCFMVWSHVARTGTAIKNAIYISFLDTLNNYFQHHQLSAST